MSSQKILSIRTDADNVQWVIPEVSKEKLLDTLKFDCQKKDKDFYKVEWYIFNPKENKANFYTGVSGALIFDEQVYNSDIFDLFEMAGEIIPLKLEDGQTLYALNVLECINSLDKKNTVRDVYDDGTPGRILKYAFHKDRISESSIFKIPETSTTEILTYSNVKNADDEFYYLYKKYGFTGLVFNELQ